MNPFLIAEVKTQSPFGYKSEKSWDELFEIANQFGNAISIHTDPRWGGSFSLIKKARKLTNKPILAKGIHSSDDDLQKAFDNGATTALVVGRIPTGFNLFKVLIEPNNLKELSMIPHECNVVWNSRNLATGGLKKTTFDQARRKFKGWMCQASNIKSPIDVHKAADAILIGTNLETFCKSL